MGVWIAIADAQKLAHASYGEDYIIRRRGYGASLMVHDSNAYQGDSRTIRNNRFQVRFEDERRWRASGLDPGDELLPMAPTFGNQAPRGVRHLPLQVSVERHPLLADGGFVQEELDLVAVAVDPDVNVLAFLSWPVPVREHVEYRLVA